MHPLVRDLYKRVLVVGRDYPNMEFQRVKDVWKAALRNSENCPSWYRDEEAEVDLPSNQQLNEVTEQATEEKDIDEL
jgi:hypothetical protein